MEMETASKEEGLEEWRQRGEQDWDEHPGIKKREHQDMEALNL